MVYYFLHCMLHNVFYIRVVFDFLLKEHQLYIVPYQDCVYLIKRIQDLCILVGSLLRCLLPNSGTSGL